MTMAARIAALATRIALEIKSLRADLSAVPTGFGNVSGGSANQYFGWSGTRIDNGNASSTFLDGVFVNGGNA